MFSIGQSVLSHKHRYGNRKIQAQFEATYKIVKKKKSKLSVLLIRENILW